MSLNAYIWASNLPLDIVGSTTYRVLLKYADRVDEHGKAAWFNTEELGQTLGCSKRTVQRALRELLDSGLMREGDQRYVQHIRGGNRPTVYDLNLRGDIAPTLDIGGVTYGVTPDKSGGDSSGLRGVTTGVAHRTVIEPNRDINNLSTGRGDKSVTPQTRSGWVVPEAPKIQRYVPEPAKPRPEPRTTAEAELVSDLESMPCTAAPAFHHLFPLGIDECVRGCGTNLTRTEILK